MSAAVHGSGLADIDIGGEGNLFATAQNSCKPFRPLLFFTLALTHAGAMQQSEIGLLSAWAQLSSQAITLPDVFDNSMFNTDRDLIKEKFAVVYDDVVS